MDVKVAILLDSPLAKEIAMQSATAVAHLWDGNLWTFWRSTEHRARDEGKTVSPIFFPTVTFRCTEALIDLLLHYPEWLSHETKDVLYSCIPTLLSHSLVDINSTLDVDDKPGTHNPFTTSLYICTLSKILGLRDLDIDEQKALNNLTAAISLIQRQHQPDGIKIHPFIQFHIVRALWASINILKKTSDVSNLQEFIRRIILDFRSDIERLLAKHVLGRLAPSDAVALVFCAASLAMVGRDEDTQYVLTALDVGLEAQDSTGCWPLGRVVGIHKDLEGPQIEISTYEIAWAASRTLLALGKRKRRILLSEKAARAVKRLVLAGRYVQASSIELTTDRNPKRGWCSDHPYGKPLIESWTCANVLQEAVSLYSLMLRSQWLRLELAKLFISCS